MEINVQPMGSYMTNCYVVSNEEVSVIIDPGVGAVSWVKEHVKRPIAILNTHGHFDHVWSNQALKEELNIPIYCPKDDAFLLSADAFGFDLPPSQADVLIDHENWIELEGIRFRFRHFAGHTPGCSIIEFEEFIMSGDFIFEGSIGRVDFPYSDPRAMKRSIERFLTLYDEGDKIIYSGHGNPTDVASARSFLPAWLRHLN